MNTNIRVLLLTIATSSISIAQDAAKVQSRIDGTQTTQPAPVSGQVGGGQATSGTDAAESDTGAQRPISLRKGGISGYFGYDTKYFYRSNPLSQEGDLKQLKTAMWTNTFFTGAGIGIIEADNSVITPYIGISWSVNDYIEDNLSSFNHNDTSAYALLLAQYGNGWAARIGVSYSNSRSTEFDTEDFSELFPNIGVMKSFSINDQTIAIFDAYLGQHSTTISAISGLTEEDGLDNFEIAASYGLKYTGGALSVSPKYLISYKTFENGANADRNDFSHILSLKGNYMINDSFDLGVFGTYTVRDSDVDINDYKNLDGGLGVTLNARF